MYRIAFGLLALSCPVLMMACGDVDCVEYCESGCGTFDQVLDRYSDLINCCSGLYLPDDRVEWENRWEFVPVPLLVSCVESVGCTEGPLTCENRDVPFTWGDQEDMDACMRGIVDAGVTSCSDGMLMIREDRVGCLLVDCDAFCGERQGGCLKAGGRADCGCGFLLPY